MDYPTKPTDATARLAKLYLAGQNPNTLAARARDLRAFAEFIGAGDLATTAAMLLSRGPGEANALALEWRSALIAQKLAPKTVNRRLSSLRSLVKLGRMLGIVPWALEVHDLKAESYRDTRGPGRVAIRRALQVLAEDPSPAGRRDGAITWLLVSPALRTSEICSLDREAVDLKGRRISVLRKGKTSKRWMTIPDQTAKALQEWMDSPACPVQGALFVGLDNRSKGRSRLVRSSINRICTKLQLGHPHGLRHSAVTLALDETNGDIRRAQKFAGHANPQTTLIYDDNRLDLAGRVAQQVADAI